jgi:hypothetical protein
MFFLKYILNFGPMPLFLVFNTPTIQIKSIIHNSIAKFAQNPYNLAGLEHGSSVPEADAMSTAPRLHPGQQFCSLLCR